MFKNYFNDYAGFTSIPKEKLSPLFIMLDIKFYEIENPHDHVRNFVSAMTLKGIDKDIFHIIFPLTFDQDVMRWSNAMDPKRS